MKMFIASTISDTIDLFVKKVKKKGLKVLFVTNPGDPFKNKYWINKDRKAFVDNGFYVDGVDIRIIDCSIFEEMLKKHDVLHICGGSALYILKLLREKKIDKVIVDYVAKGKIIYTGTSAGSMIMAPNVSFCADDEDEQEAGMVGKLKNLNALGLMPFYVICHAQEKDYIPSTKRSIDRLPKNKLPILFLNDNMALWIEDGRFEFLKN